MKSVKLCLRFLLLMLVFSSVSVASAAPKKAFTKGDGKEKSALGENTLTTASGVQYKDIKVGTGKETIVGRVVWIDYKGWVMPEMREFDNTITKKQPFNMLLGGKQICQGLDDGIKGMKEGGKRLLLIPPDLGFPKGSATTRIIPPGSTLKYEITLLQVGGRYTKPADKPSTAATTGKVESKTGQQAAPKSN